MRKNVILIAILAAALLLPFAANVEKAGADTLLFPWIVKSDSVSTVISVVNTAESVSEAFGGPGELHFQYFFKNSTANGQTERCSAGSKRAPASKDDIVSFDTSAHWGEGKPLFDDDTNGDESLALSASSPRRAFLIVDNDDREFVEAVENLGGSRTNVDGTLYGEAIVIEKDSGSAWGYIAYNGVGGQRESGENPNEVRFGPYRDQMGEVISDSETTQTVILPTDLVETRFFMTPVNTSTQRIGDANSAVQLCATPDNDGGCDQPGIWRNDERVFNGAPEKQIVCTSADTLEDLLTEDSWNEFSGQTATDYHGQGWTNIVVNRGDMDNIDPTHNYEEDQEMIIGKLEFSIGSIDFDGAGGGDAASGTFNNFVWLRDNEDYIDFCFTNSDWRCRRGGTSRIRNRTMDILN
jgi:hypothetical protein